MTDKPLSGLPSTQPLAYVLGEDAAGDFAKLAPADIPVDLSKASLTAIPTGTVSLMYGQNASGVLVKQAPPSGGGSVELENVGTANVTTGTLAYMMGLDSSGAWVKQTPSIGGGSVSITSDALSFSTNWLFTLDPNYDVHVLHYTGDQSASGGFANNASLTINAGTGAVFALPGGGTDTSIILTRYARQLVFLLSRSTTPKQWHLISATS